MVEQHHYLALQALSQISVEVLRAVQVAAGPAAVVVAAEAFRPAGVDHPGAVAAALPRVSGIWSAVEAVAVAAQLLAAAVQAVTRARLALAAAARVQAVAVVAEVVTSERAAAVGVGMAWQVRHLRLDTVVAAVVVERTLLPVLAPMAS